MPVLNPEIFTDALIKCLEEDNDSRTLGKFMLSGRESLHAALNYFKKAKWAHIDKDDIDIGVQFGRTTRSHSISYQFSLINLIMKVLGSSIEEFGIRSVPKDFDAIECLLEHKIKKVHVNPCLPEKYRTLITSGDFIENVIVHLEYKTFCEYVKPLDMIPSSCRELIFCFTRFDGQYMSKVMKLSKEYVRNIEKLEIDAYSSFPKRYISSFILNNFPRLQTVKMEATYHEDIKYVIEMFNDKELKFLEKLKKSKITGKLVFENSIRPHSRKVIPAFEQVLQDVQGIPNITSDAEHKTITRTVELKKDFIVEIMLVFRNYKYYNKL